MSQHDGARSDSDNGPEAARIIPAQLGVTALVGHSRLGPVGRPHLCESESDFNRHFGDWEEAGVLAAAAHGFFQNGGRHLYVLNLGPEERGLGPGDLAPLDALVEVELVAAPGKTLDADHRALLDHASRARTRLALLDGPEDLEAELARLRPPRGPGGAIYVPWLLVHDPVRRELVRTPPSGFMAGLMARVARDRGVHKAPANEAIFGVAGLAHRVTQAEQDILHPRCVNAIRKLPQVEGVRPWAAKTLAERDPFRTIAAFRVWAHVVRSLEQGTTWLVGEASEPVVWGRLEEAGRVFLEGLRASGALVGESPEEAFRFRCDAETNSPELAQRGVAVCRIGLALAWPGHFFTFEMGLDLTRD